MLKELRKLLEPFGIANLFTDDWGAYHRVPLAPNHFVGMFRFSWKMTNKPFIMCR
ncbi:hypothetical protein MAIT1_05224 [Magnetofaba australis IT-1]|uniref:Uncharacterized protein n=1 Tax=Magnetofaba australis IT-1 TaxID=1434232 RepID=A0A1Y2K3L8_9PROT|nr:hypothetical protein MAIT1_05224 [Magnetofaba australis IT-1]